MRNFEAMRPGRRFAEKVAGRLLEPQLAKRGAEVVAAKLAEEAADRRSAECDEGGYETGA